MHGDTWRKTNKNRKEEKNGGYWDLGKINGKVEEEWMGRWKKNVWEYRRRMDMKVEGEWMGI